MLESRGISTRASLWKLALLSVVLLTASCTSHIAHSPYIKASLTDQDYEAALSRIERIDKKNSRLLYLYEKGLVHHYQSSYEASNAVFEEAELLYDELYTKSLSREIGSLITSDNVIKYRGERYEVAMIHYYKILNYLYLDEPDGALVECRRLNNRLQMFADDEETVYQNDPFLEYLTGMVYLAFGENTDAGVSLRVAAQSYGEADGANGLRRAEHLYCDLITSAERLHDAEAAARYREEGHCREPVALGGDSGVLNLFLECGYVAFKIEENAVIPLYKHELTDGLVTEDYARVLYQRYGEPRNHELELAYLLRVAMPAMVANPFPHPDVEVQVAHGGKTYRSHAQVVENMDALAFNSFEHRQGMIIFKTILRGLTKYLAKRGVEKKKGEVAGWVVNAINVATESADTRSWTTLPQTIRMARLVLPPGRHDIEVRLFDPLGRNVETFVIPRVGIAAGRTTFLNYRIY